MARNLTNKKPETQPKEPDTFDASTTDDSDDDLSAVPSSLPVTISRSPPINREGQSTPDKTTAPSEKHGGVSASEVATTDTTRSESPAEQPKALPNTASKPKSRLGKIGGKKSVPSQATVDIRASQGAIAAADTVAVPSKTDTVAATGLPATDLVSRNRGDVVKDDKPKPQRETSQERADRNREKLKRELEKSQAGGKKKRRF